MNFEDCKQGMLIRISKDISETIAKLGGGSHKVKLAGTMQTIDSIKFRNKSLLIKGWHFLPENINLVTDISIEGGKMYNISEVYTGMSIRLANNVENSIRKFGGGGRKRRLTGTKQIINRVQIDRNSVRIYDNGKSWHFLVSDLRKDKSQIVTSTTAPEIFDPSQLVLD